MSLRERFRPAAPTATPPCEASASQALAAKRGRLRASPPPSAGRALAAVLRPLLRDGGAGLSDLKRRWGEIAGAGFARAQPEKLAAGVLTLRAPGSLAPFLQQQVPLLLERLRLTGFKVKTIRIEQRTAATPVPNLALPRAELSPAEEAALAQALDPGLDPNLKSALMRLGSAVRRG